MGLGEKIKEVYEKSPDLKEIAELPNSIMIEITNRCNFRCIMCANKTMTRQKGMMDYELYKEIIDQCAELGIENVALYSTGEAFIHPDLEDMISYAKGMGIKYVYVTTNGLLVSKRNAEKIIRAGLDSIKFSIDAGNKEDYERIRVGGNWEMLIENIRYLRELRDKTNSPLKIYGSYLIRKGAEEDKKKYEEIFGKLVDETVYGYLNNQGGQVDIVEGPVRTTPCNYLWNRFVINYDGTVTMCCIDFDGQLNYADVRKKSLKEIWNCANMREARRNHLNGDFHKMPMCKSCINEEGIWNTE